MCFLVVESTIFLFPASHQENVRYWPAGILFTLFPCMAKTYQHTLAEGIAQSIDIQSSCTPAPISIITRMSKKHVQPVCFDLV